MTLRRYALSISYELVHLFIHVTKPQSATLARLLANRENIVLELNSFRELAGRIELSDSGTITWWCPSETDFVEACEAAELLNDDSIRHEFLFP
jgi:hypothetical protein